LFPLLLSFITFASLGKKLPLQHSVKASQDLIVNEYFISEKLDGIRGYWDGTRLYTRQGNIINAPKWFTKGWPIQALDGEIWSKRDDFQSILSCVNRKYIKQECWHSLTLMVFDLPGHSGSFSQRVKAMKQLLFPAPSKYLAMIAQQKLASRTQLLTLLANVEKQNGEGLMLHHQDALYQQGRNNQLMKLKTFLDDEAVVLKHFSGKGKYTGMLGAMLVRTKQGIEFKIGTGFTNEQRKKPPPLGSIITFKYIGKTKQGVPRFASFLRVRYH